MYWAKAELPRLTELMLGDGQEMDGLFTIVDIYLFVESVLTEDEWEEVKGEGF